MDSNQHHNQLLLTVQADLNRAVDAKMAKIQKEQLKTVTFPMLLMEILSDETNASAISWLPHGLSFRIHDRPAFLQLLTDYERRYSPGKQNPPPPLPPSLSNGQTAQQQQQQPRTIKWTSLTRKLHRWNILRMAAGPDSGAYQHPLMQRDCPELCADMVIGGDGTTVSEIKTARRAERGRLLADHRTTQFVQAKARMIAQNMTVQDVSVQRMHCCGLLRLRQIQAVQQMQAAQVAQAQAQAQAQVQAQQQQVQARAQQRAQQQAQPSVPPLPSPPVQPSQPSAQPSQPTTQAQTMAASHLPALVRLQELVQQSKLAAVRAGPTLGFDATIIEAELQAQEMERQKKNQREEKEQKEMGTGQQDQQKEEEEEKGTEIAKTNEATTAATGPAPATAHAAQSVTQSIIASAAIQQEEERIRLLSEQIRLGRQQQAQAAAVVAMAAATATANPPTTTMTVTAKVDVSVPKTDMAPQDGRDTVTFRRFSNAQA